MHRFGLYHAGGKSPITGSITDEKGDFRIDNVHPGTYNLVITYIGYPTKTVGPFVTTNSKPDNNVGSIVVSPGAKTLIRGKHQRPAGTGGNPCGQGWCIM